MFGHQFPSWAFNSSAQKTSLTRLLSDKVDFFVTTALKEQNVHRSSSEADLLKDALKKEFLTFVKDLDLDNKIAKNEMIVPENLLRTIHHHLTCFIKEQMEIDTLSPKTTPGRI